MCDSKNQCCAPVNNRRCQNNTINGSHHCSEHHDISKKLYLDYKKICDVAYSFDINKSIENVNHRIKYLFKCYMWLNKAYDARFKHRQYSYTPECYDEGHNLQFSLIKDKIKNCEDNLSRLYQDKNRENKQISDEIDDSEEDNQIIEKIENCRKTRTRLQTNENKLIETYIRENRLLIDRKRKLIDLFVTNVKKLFRDKIELNCENIFLFCVSLQNLIFDLFDLNYFDENFEPVKCECDECSEYIKYKTHLSCSCIFQHNSIIRYFNLATEKTLMFLNQLIIKNSDKIKPITDDLLTFYKTFDDQFIFLNVNFSWNDDKKRLEIEQANKDDVTNRKILRHRIAMMKEERTRS